MRMLSSMRQEQMMVESKWVRETPSLPTPRSICSIISRIPQASLWSRDLSNSNRQCTPITRWGPLAHQSAKSSNTKLQLRYLQADVKMTRCLMTVSTEEVGWLQAMYLPARRVLSLPRTPRRATGPRDHLQMLQTVRLELWSTFTRELKSRVEVSIASSPPSCRICIREVPYLDRKALIAQVSRLWRYRR